MKKNALLSILRKRTGNSASFRGAADELAVLLAKDMASAFVAKNPSIVLVPILRSGLALLPPFLAVFPNAKVGFIGLKRNEKTLKAKCYYQNLPKISKGDTVIVLDPMLATGGSAVEAIRFIVNSGVKEEQIIFIGVISAPEGVATLHKHFPLVCIGVAAEDKKLDKHGFILPGLGDFGDRYFGTEL